MKIKALILLTLLIVLSACSTPVEPNGDPFADVPWNVPGEQQ